MFFIISSPNLRVSSLSRATSTTCRKPSRASREVFGVEGRVSEAMDEVTDVGLESWVGVEDRLDAWRTC